MIYVLATLIATFVALLSVRKRPVSLDDTARRTTVSLPVLSVAFLVLFAVSALRYNVGTDYLTIYVARFRLIAAGVTVPWDVGFLALNRLVGAFTNNAAWLFVVTSLVTVGLTFRAIAKYSLNVPLSVLLFVIGGFYFTSFNAVREWMAIAIFLNAIPFIEKRDFKRYLVLVLAASCFHASALLYLPLYFLARLRIGPRTALVAAVGAAFAAGSVSILLTRVIGLTKYGWYASSQFSRADTAVADLVVGALILAFGYWITYRNGGRIGHSEVQLTVLMNIQLFAAITAVLSAGFFILSRVVMLMTAVQILLLPAILARVESPLERTAYEIWMVACFVATCWFLYGVLGHSNVFPYQTVFGAV